MSAEQGTETLLVDEQFANLLEQAAVILSALERRAFDVLGVVLPAEGLATMIARRILKPSDDFAAITGRPVVSMSAARAARAALAPRVPAHVTASFSADAQAAVDELANRIHGRADVATRSLVMQAAIDRGLQQLASGAR